MRQTLRTLFTVAFCMLLIGGVGCSRMRKTRTRVSGYVTANGQPVSAGKITFRPMNGGKTQIDTIRNGNYAVRSRYAMPAGEYEVSVDYSSSRNGLAGTDRHYVERVTIAPLGTTHIDFHLK